MNIEEFLNQLEETTDETKWRLKNGYTIDDWIRNDKGQCPIVFLANQKGINCGRFQGSSIAAPGLGLDEDDAEKIMKAADNVGHGELRQQLLEITGL